jgi:hypothetical protein
LLQRACVKLTEKDRPTTHGHPPASTHGAPAPFGTRPFDAHRGRTSLGAHNAFASGSAHIATEKSSAASSPNLLQRPLTDGSTTGNYRMKGMPFHPSFTTDTYADTPHSHDVEGFAGRPLANRAHPPICNRAGSQRGEAPLPCHCYQWPAWLREAPPGTIIQVKDFRSQDGTTITVTEGKPTPCSFWRPDLVNPEE